MYSTEATINQTDRNVLLDTARSSIQHGLESGKALAVNSADYPDELQAERACFVTLQIAGELRGCIGHLQAVQPLIRDVAENAWAAAFQDPRFAPLSQAEFPRLEIHISILSPPLAMSFTSQQDLLAQIRPGIDGLILEDGYRRGTFLPSVWESLPEVSDFLAHLKLKAGLPASYWSDSIRVSRYTSESITDAS
jgi:AmmeMemoRadiSam system protein A